MKNKFRYNDISLAPSQENEESSIACLNRRIKEVVKTVILAYFYSDNWRQKSIMPQTAIASLPLVLLPVTNDILNLERVNAMMLKLRARPDYARVNKIE